MNKAILIIDMPTVCGNCKLAQYFVANHKSRSYCGACGISIKDNEILKDCPLKPLPKIPPHIEFDEYCGYEQCLKDILGEEE